MGVPDRPNAAGSIYSTAEQLAYFDSLPTMFGASAALFTSPAGHVLLVKPNYRDLWSLPGGMLDDGEPPHEGCRREVEEEIGLQITPGPLLTVGWVAPYDTRHRPIVHFIFDGGELDAATPIRLQESELDGYRFVAPGDLAEYLPPFMTTRVTAALQRRAGQGPAYLPEARP
jgi:8-oxo-dGTP diphosphatase